jgi:hypothetical protein
MSMSIGYILETIAQQEKTQRARTSRTAWQRRQSKSRRPRR